MRPEDLDRALGPTPSSFSGRMEHTLLHLKEEQEVKRFAYRTVLIVALITALLGTTAFALVNQGLDWYYAHRFTAYQEQEPEKHEAILTHRRTDVPQAPVSDPDVNLLVAETSWAPEQHTLVVSLMAAPAHPEQAELHPLWNLDADASYGDIRQEHWLWTKDGFGPVAEMLAPGKTLLLLEADSVYLDDIRLMGDMSSMDAYVTEEGAIHTVLEIRMEDFFDPAFADKVQAYIAQSPDNADYWVNRLTEVERFRHLLAEAEDGALTLTLPYAVVAYNEENMTPRQGELRFEVKLR